MSIDVSKLPAAPWQYIPGDDGGIVGNINGYPVLLAEDDTPSGVASLQFVALARNAFAGDLEALKWWEAHRTQCSTR
jgi:hypothetical protein